MSTSRYLFLLANVWLAASFAMPSGEAVSLCAIGVASLLFWRAYTAWMDSLAEKKPTKESDEKTGP